ncbi:Adenylate and Guanylate cyclase catalytic domain-containing protein [Mucilaginibacter sp. OK268]|uniref:adenylate/guanylate cyclase domain-containing protein n=1 Tax=Mucilaginibacter sp. OK268 TaxID=1881048 RepID=UPI00088B0F71|nr:adenylate/guanylate cyclase domain-containing protein [Mucilaginibacter sp. OK268]SDP86386.1 Adenylate and Guanylate cyclase catalytic domain-containing protein [Mucilaginibacter sp. OK268]
MALKDIISEIEQDVADVASTSFDYANTNIVPSTNDNGLSFERGKAKNGKILNTCVLYVDIRNSVSLTQTHSSKTMGQIYTAFTKAVVKAGRHHGGHTRNIIGDRVMLVFPSDNCCSKAVSCAITINHISRQVISKRFPNVDFKVGIGIDYGELKIIKVGIQRNGNESPENKGLVWTGYPANIASRLTDMGNKKVDETYYLVHYYSLNLTQLLGKYNLPGQSFYANTPTKMELSEAGFADCIRMHNNGNIYFLWGKLKSFEKLSRSNTFPAILITEKVLRGLRSEAVNAQLYKPSLWLEQNHPIKNVTGKVYGSNATWTL